MSEILLEDSSGLTVSQYIGPEPGFTWADDPLSADRRRYQITNEAGLLTTLSAAQWKALCDFASDKHVGQDGWTYCGCTCSNCSGCTGDPP